MGSQTIFDEYLGEEYDMEGDMDYGDHGALIEAVNQMDGYQRIKPPVRTEASLQVSEFNMPPLEGGNVHVRDLTRTLEAQGKIYGNQVAHKLRILDRRYPLHAPLEKHEQERIKRIVGYKNVKRNVERWDATVHANKASRSLSFPLNIGSVKMLHTSDFLSKRSKPSNLEEGINKLLGKSTVAKEDNEAEKVYKLTLAELRAKRKEMAKLRAQQSYEIVRAKRLKNIKSKKYRRILKRDKMFSQLKDFEALQKTDPEAALKQLEQLEQARAEERMTLRHKSTGTWARSRLIRAKYDRETRVELAEQLAKSRELTKKVKVDNNSEDESDNPDTRLEVEKMFEGDASNPWVTVKPKLEILEFVSGYQKYWGEQNKKERRKECELRQEEKKKKIESQIREKQNKNKSNKKSAPKIISRNASETKSSRQPQNKRLVMNGVSKHNVIQLQEDKSSHLCSAALNTTITKPHKRTHNSFKAPKVSDVKSAEVKSKEKNIELEQNESLSAPKSNVSERSEYDTNFPTKSVKKTKFTHGVWDVTSFVEDEPEKSTECIELDLTESSLLSDDKELVEEDSDCRLRNFKSFVEANSTEGKKDKKKRKKKTEIEKMFNDKMSEEIQMKIDKIKADLKSSSKVIERKQKKKSRKANDLGASLAMKSMREMRPIIDEPLLEGQEEEDTVKNMLSLSSNANENGPTNDSGNAASNTDANSKPKDAIINPNNFIVAKPKLLLTAVPDIVTAGDEALDDEYEENQQTVISEAFAEDDVVDKFRKEKEDDIKKNKLKDVDLNLPGWGSWGGEGIDPTKRKNNRLILKAPRPAPRKDENKSNVVIKEDKAKEIRKLQVRDLPKPFSSVSDFEASIRAPVGNTFVPQTAHQKFIKPNIITKMGSVIKPMDEQFLVNKEVFNLDE